MYSLFLLCVHCIRFHHSHATKGHLFCCLLLVNTNTVVALWLCCKGSVATQYNASQTHEVSKISLPQLISIITVNPVEELSCD